MLCKAAVLLPMILLLASLPHPQSELVTAPVEVAVQPGEDAELKCTWGGEENSTKTTTFTWRRLHAGDVEVAVNDSSSNVQVVGGTLTIRNASFTDAGDYRCLDDAGSEPAVATVIVYNMPGYGREWAVVAGVVGLLLALVGARVGYDALRRKRAARAREEGAARGKGEEGRYPEKVERVEVYRTKEEAMHNYKVKEEGTYKMEEERAHKRREFSF